MKHLPTIINSFVYSLHNGTIKSNLINHVPRRAAIEAVGGVARFSNIALNAVDSRPTVDKILTYDNRLHTIKLSQEREQDPWPHTEGGYMDYITDSREEEYWCAYVGQTSDLSRFGGANLCKSPGFQQSNGRMV
ncbi:hypothetical protein N7478_002374 [Penicillium angulare]|uniref:uncharacterized protein n=1 Tax=Penicillium angulare TaxID=116970 RepID=UPI0025425634|nr:uncharacterized protein N7478_002374 [Penicillium angulare]KAJ5286688.1 hypothetical protein N7478_002374 [Penicillium angulare]